MISFVDRRSDGWPLLSVAYASRYVVRHCMCLGETLLVLKVVILIEFNVILYKDFTRMHNTRTWRKAYTVDTLRCLPQKVYRNQRNVCVCVRACARVRVRVRVRVCVCVCVCGHTKLTQTAQAVVKLNNQ
jgi:hypothetical protein